MIAVKSVGSNPTMYEHYYKRLFLFSPIACFTQRSSNGCSADCKSVAFRHWGFESLSLHDIPTLAVDRFLSGL